MAIVGVAGLTAILLYCMATYGNIWLAYVGYCLVRVSYQVLMTVASFEIVKYLPEDAFALIFGINTFAAVGVQSLLSLIVNTILGKKIMPCPFTGPKIFCAGPNFLSQPKNLTAFSASSKTFVPAQKPILLNTNHLLSGTKCL